MAILILNVKIRQNVLEATQDSNQVRLYLKPNIYSRELQSAAVLCKKKRDCSSPFYKT